jgi:hypothetical protein
MSLTAACHAIAQATAGRGRRGRHAEALAKAGRLRGTVAAAVSAAGVLSGHSCPCHGDHPLLTRGGNRAGDIGSGKLGTRFALEFADC